MNGIAVLNVIVTIITYSFGNVTGFNLTNDYEMFCMGNNTTGYLKTELLSMQKVI